MANNTFILQWNLNGYFTHIESIKLLINDYLPLVICIEETHFKHQNVTLKNYVPFLRNRVTDHSSGGTAIFVRDDIESTEIQLQTNLEIVAVSVTHKMKINICNVYLPHPTDLDITELSNVLNQIPHPKIILGDFNCHNSTWGSNKTDKCGNLLNNLIDNLNLVLLNTGKSTRFNSYNGTFSAIDLSLCSPSLATLLYWDTLGYLYDSDHFPITINIDTNDILTFPIHQTWKIKSADWDLYRTLIEGQTNNFNLTNTANENLELFNNIIISAATIAVGKTKSSKRQPVPWWNNEIAQALTLSKHAFNVYKKHKTIDNLIIFKNLRAKSRQLIKKGKRDSWKKYVASINPSTPIGDIWNKVRRIKGTKYFRGIDTLSYNNQMHSNKVAIPEILADIYELNSSDSNYSISFLEYKNLMESSNIQITESDNPINKPISLQELEFCLSAKNSTPGPDDIHPLFLRNLPLNAKLILVDIFNNIFIQHDFPDLWSQATIIPILKYNKPKDDPNSYRPISLTCCTCKLLEKILNYRLNGISKTIT